MRVDAVIVTFNRRALLRECLAAVAAQTRPPDRVLVVDNASTDGTAAMVREEFSWAELLTLPENVGGAGGFHAGMRNAREDGADWLWLMDDDSIPRQDALAELLSAHDRAPEPKPALLASKVVWTDGRLHPMNFVAFDRFDVPGLLDGVERGLAPLRQATFVSLLVAAGAIDRHGLPYADYFIWSDDQEWTARVTRDGHDRAVFVASSVVEHRTRAPYTALSSSGPRFYYHVRNNVWFLRTSSLAPEEKVVLFYAFARSLVYFMHHNRWDLGHAGIVVRGLRDGFRRLPA